MRDGDWELAEGELRMLLIFWKTLGVEPNERICIILSLHWLNEERNLLSLWSVDGACSISSSRRIKYSKSFENPGDSGRAFVTAVDVLLFCSRDEQKGEKKMIIDQYFNLPPFINKFLVIELRDLWISPSILLSLLLGRFWADWSSSICWFISIR